MSTKTTKMMQWLDYRVRVTVSDNRVLVGTFKAFDKYMNLVLSDCEEFRRMKVEKKSGEEREVKRVLGFVVLRGENVLSMTAEAPPANMGSNKMAPGPGKAAVAGRGAPVTGMSQSNGVAGLTAPARGVGAPGTAQMQPRGGAMRAPGMPPM